MYCPNPRCPDLARKAAPAEFRDTASVCPACGTELAAAMPSWASTATDDESFVPCMTVANAGLLPHIKALLDSAQLRYFVKNDGLQTVMGWGAVGLGYNNVFGPPVIMVDPNELDAARALLQGFEEPAPNAPRSVDASSGVASKGPLRCSHCGKNLEADKNDDPLTHCYFCGWSLESA